MYIQYSGDYCYSILFSWFSPELIIHSPEPRYEILGRTMILEKVSCRAPDYAFSWGVSCKCYDKSIDLKC